jgi:hypothetical protein
MGAKLPYYPHNQVDLQELISNFKLDRGLLLPNGQLEVLMRSTV